MSNPIGDRGPPRYAIRPHMARVVRLGSVTGEPQLRRGCYRFGMPWTDEGFWIRDPLAYQGMQLLGAALKRRRLKLGLSQTRLGRMTGIDQSTISRFENGKRFGLRWWRFAVMVAVLGGLDFGDLAGVGAYGRRPPVNPYLAARAARANDPDGLGGGDDVPIGIEDSDVA